MAPSIAAVSATAPKTVLITGGSRGIGLGFAQHYFELGYNIIIVSSSQESAQQGVEELLQSNPKRARSQKVVALGVDLSRPEKVGPALDKIEDSLIDSLHGVVYSAGLHILDNESTGDINKMLTIKNESAIELYEYLLPWLLQNRGHTILVSSISAVIPRIHLNGHYKQSNVRLFEIGANIQEKYPEISVTVTTPSIIDTDMARNILGRDNPITDMQSIPLEQMVAITMADNRARKFHSFPGVNARLMANWLNAIASLGGGPWIRLMQKLMLDSPNSPITRAYGSYCSTILRFWGLKGR